MVEQFRTLDNDKLAVPPKPKTGDDDDEEDVDDGTERTVTTALCSHAPRTDAEAPDAWAFVQEPSKLDFPHAVAIAKSLAWPGAVAVAQLQSKGVQFVNVYIGYGQKSLPTRYTPPALPPIQSEYAVPAKVANSCSIRLSLAH